MPDSSAPIHGVKGTTPDQVGDEPGWGGEVGPFGSRMAGRGDGGQVVVARLAAPGRRSQPDGRIVVQEGEHGQVVQPVVFQLRPPERALALETRLLSDP